jgi:hypothetical protein
MVLSLAFACLLPYRGFLPPSNLKILSEEHF